MEGFLMPKITFTDYGPDDAFYSEGPQSYTPHWAKTLLLKPKQPSPPKPEKPPSKTLSDEQERLVAEIKRHHPMATTEGILEHLKEWGGGIETNPDHHEAEIDDRTRTQTMKLINKGWAKPGDEIPQPVSIVLGGNLRQNTEPKIKQPSPMQLEERERLVAEIKRHHPQATTEQILKDLEAWGE
jgi:hypothetical protein